MFWDDVNFRLEFRLMVRDSKGRPIKKSVKVRNSHFLSTSLRTRKKEYWLFWSGILKNPKRKKVTNFEFLWAFFYYSVTLMFRVTFMRILGYWHLVLTANLWSGRKFMPDHVGCGLVKNMWEKDKLTLTYFAFFGDFAALHINGWDFMPN